MLTCTAADMVGDGAGHLGCLCHRPEIQALTLRINVQLSRRGFVTGAGASIAALGVPRQLEAEIAPEPPLVLTNFLLFDGKSVDVSL